jgi:hypothetical protein
MAVNLAQQGQSVLLIQLDVWGGAPARKVVRNSAAEREVAVGKHIVQHDRQVLNEHKIKPAPDRPVATIRSEMLARSAYGQKTPPNHNSELSLKLRPCLRCPFEPVDGPNPVADVVDSSKRVWSKRASRKPDLPTYVPSSRNAIWPK